MNERFLEAVGPIVVKEVRQGLDIILVEHMDEVLEHTLAKTEKSPDFRQTRNLTTH